MAAGHHQQEEPVVTTSLAALLTPPAGMNVDFRNPPGAPALIPADSLSWQIFANPVTLFVGGVTAVILELAEPSVRAGVWDHSSFRRDPLGRLHRTGTAAMITVYAPAPAAEAMIARVVQMHDRVRGTLADGQRYDANDARLLDWVQATASFGFIEAYSRFARPLDDDAKSTAFAEGAVAARLYGATGAPTSHAEWEAQLAAMLPALEPSPVLDEFLHIMRTHPILPAPLRSIQALLVDAAITILPELVKARLGLDGVRLSPARTATVKGMARLAGATPMPFTPAAQARQRMRAA